MEKETKEWTIDSLIKELNKFPKDKPVHLFTGYTWESDDIEKIQSVGYPKEMEDDTPIDEWETDKTYVGIFTKSYCEFTIEFLESEGY